MLNNLSKVMDAPFILRQVPDAIPADLRPLWRVGLCIAILKHSRGNAASLRKLHVLSWAISRVGNQELVLNAITNKSFKKQLVVRYDPALDRALDFALGEGLVAIASGAKYKLTESGVKLCEEIAESELLKQIKFLEEHGSEFTEFTIDNLLDWNG